MTRVDKFNRDVNWTIAGIGMIVGRMIAEGRFYPEEVSTLTDEICQMGNDFVRLGGGSGDYEEDLKCFVESRMKAFYGLAMM